MNKAREMSMTEARKYAKNVGVEIGKLTTERCSQGEYTVYENGRDTYFTQWEEGKNAMDAKIAYILARADGFY